MSSYRECDIFLEDPSGGFHSITSKGSYNVTSVEGWADDVAGLRQNQDSLGIALTSELGVGVLTLGTVLGAVLSAGTAAGTAIAMWNNWQSAKSDMSNAYSLIGQM